MAGRMAHHPRRFRTPHLPPPVKHKNPKLSEPERRQSQREAAREALREVHEQIRYWTGKKAAAHRADDRAAAGARHAAWKMQLMPRRQALIELGGIPAGKVGA